MVGKAGFLLLRITAFSRKNSNKLNKKINGLITNNKNAELELENKYSIDLKKAWPFFSTHLNE